ncbi:MAG: hypothetical protein AAGD22_03500 [Verrucomicrobiota bacterium]
MKTFFKLVGLIAGLWTLGFAIFVGVWLGLATGSWEIDEVEIDSRNRVVVFGVGNLDLNYDIFYRVYRDSKQLYESDPIFCADAYGDLETDYEAYVADNGTVGIFSRAKPREIIGIMNIRNGIFPSKEAAPVAKQLLAELEDAHGESLEFDDFTYWDRHQ